MAGAGGSDAAVGLAAGTAGNGTCAAAGQACAAHAAFARHPERQGLYLPILFYAGAGIFLRERDALV